MGEPLRSSTNMLHAIVTLKAPLPGLAAPSLSTAGLIRMRKHLLSEDPYSIDPLYIALHAADQKKRLAIIPMGQTNPIDALVHTGADFARRVGCPTVARYLLLDGCNDSAEDAANIFLLPLLNFSAKFQTIFRIVTLLAVMLHALSLMVWLHGHALETEKFPAGGHPG